MDTLARQLKLKKYDPAELKSKHRCTKCGKVLQELSHKRCEGCRDHATEYMKRYRYSGQHDTVSLETDQMTKIDDNFSEFCRYVNMAKERDVLKLVLETRVEDYIIGTERDTGEKKELIKIHYTNRLLATMEEEFVLRSTQVKAHKLYLRYMCGQDQRLKRNKTAAKLPCRSRLSITFHLQTNEMRIEFNHRCHSKLVNGKSLN